MFTVPMSFPDDLREKINASKNGKNAPLGVMMIGFDDKKEDANLVDWFVNDVTATRIEINLVFSDPIEVSQGDGLDYLIVSI